MAPCCPHKEALRLQSMQSSNLSKQNPKRDQNCNALKAVPDLRMKSCSRAAPRLEALQRGLRLHSSASSRSASMSRGWGRPSLGHSSSRLSCDKSSQRLRAFGNLRDHVPSLGSWCISHLFAAMLHLLCGAVVCKGMPHRCCLIGVRIQHKAEKLGPRRLESLCYPNLPKSHDSQYARQGSRPSLLRAARAATWQMKAMAMLFTRETALVVSNLCSGLLKAWLLDALSGLTYTQRMKVLTRCALDSSPFSLQGRVKYNNCKAATSRPLRFHS